MGLDTLITKQLKDFSEAKILHAADRIKELHKTAGQQRFVNRFLIPMPFWAFFRKYQLVKAYPQLQSLEEGIIINPFLSIASGALYCFMWLHLVPLVLALIAFFFSPSSFERIFQSQMNEHTLKSIILVALEMSVSGWAISSFRLTETFETQYQSLKATYDKKWEDAVVQVKVTQEIAAMKPELIKSFINKANTLFLASDEFSDAQQSKILNLISRAMDDLNVLSETGGVSPIAPSLISPLQTPLPPNVENTPNKLEDSLRPKLERTYGKDPFSKQDL